MPAAWLGQSHDTVDQFELTIAFHTCYADNFACVNRKRNIIKKFKTIASHKVQILRFEHLRSALMRSALRGKDDLPADHHLSELCLACFRSGHSCDFFALTHDGYSIAELEHFIEPMGNEKNRSAFVAQTL